VRVVHSAQSPSPPAAGRDEVLGIIRSAGQPIGAGVIVKELISRYGLDEPAARRVWDKARRSLGSTVEPVGRLYRWREPGDPEVVLRDARAALERLLQPRVTANKKRELVEAIRAALERSPVRDSPERVAELTARCEELERQLYAADTRSPEVRQAQERQLRIDAVRALAELAMEVEELTANEAEPAVLVAKVRARATREGLEPIGRAGEETTFDRARHKPIGSGLRDGAVVYVVRPGYTWHAPDEDVLIGKAIVEE
jgi:hypothetical protein